MSQIDTRALTYTVDEVAELLKISRASAYAAVRSGALPSVRLGRRWLVPRARLAQFLNGEAA
ncbi:helix-turn-helix domain-containing protein [Actinokineospora pegani]|uniref:helix-turn-helix domain-containing protein n=1 Tax=Actinokineospora pegani TaxID=2654637 RepID=UPI0012EA9DE0|nr:helix-turn-helix domain-containing protein [Actinokineospora pegani]